MRTKFFIILVAVCAAFILRPALAQSVDAPQVEPKKKPKPAKVKPAPVAAKTDLPCPRAKWKDDPVCFGENDPSALPLPSAAIDAGQGGVDPRRRHHALAQGED